MSIHVDSCSFHQMHDTTWHNLQLSMGVVSKTRTTAVNRHSWAEVQAEAPPGILFGALRRAIKGGQRSPEALPEPRSPCSDVLSDVLSTVNTPDLTTSEHRHSVTLRQVHRTCSEFDSSNPLMTSHDRVHPGRTSDEKVTRCGVLLCPLVSWTHFWTSSERTRKAFVKKIMNRWTRDLVRSSSSVCVCVCSIFSLF